MAKMIPDLTIASKPGVVPAQTTWPDTAAGQHTFQMGGDVAGTNDAATVAAIQGVAISGVAASGHVLMATAPQAAQWSPGAVGSAITQLTGDVVAGPGPGSVPGTVAAIQGVAISGVAAAGQVLTASAPLAASWQTPVAPPPASKDYALFFALMPGDNSATVAVGAPVQFPQNGPTSAGGITRVPASPSTFNLAAVGTYEVTWQVSISEAGQLQLALNGVGLANTVIGRSGLTTQFYGSTIITTATPNSVLSVINPLGNSTALTITPTAGGTSPVSATLSIKAL